MSNSHLPDRWEFKPLNDVVADTVGGFGFPRDFQGRHDLPFPFVKVSDMNLPGNEIYITTAENFVDDTILDEIRARTYPPGTIVFPKIGGAIATNKKRILGVEATFDNNVMAIVPNERKALMKWIFYYLESIDLMKLANIGPVPSIRQSTVQALPIPIPYPSDPARSIDTQHRIVARIEALLSEVRDMRALQSDIVANTNRLMNTVLADVFSSSETAIWPNIEPLGNVAEITAPLVDPTLPKYSSLPHIYGATIEEGTGRLLDYKTAAEDGMTSSKYHFQPGAVLYSKIRPYLRKATIVDFEGVCSADMYPLQVRNGKLIPEFLLWSLLSPPFTDYANNLSGRARMPKLNRSQLFDYPIPYPSREAQKRIAAKLAVVREEISELRNSNQDDFERIDQLEQAILAQAFRGEL